MFRRERRNNDLQQRPLARGTLGVKADTPDGALSDFGFGSVSVKAQQIGTVPPVQRGRESPRDFVRGEHHGLNGWRAGHLGERAIIVAIFKFQISVIDIIAKRAVCHHQQTRQ